MKVTVKQFQEIAKVNDSKLDQLDKQIKIYSIVTGKSEDYILNLPLDKIKKLAQECQVINKGKAKYLYIGGTLYKFVGLAETLTAGQYIDLKNFAKDFTNNLHLMLAIVYKPVWGKYDHKKVSEDMLKADIGKVYGTLFFCSKVLEELNPTILCSMWIAQKDIKEVMEEIASTSF